MPDPRRRRRPLVGIVVAFLVTVAACGGSSDDADDAVDAVGAADDRTTGPASVVDGPAPPTTSVPAAAADGPAVALEPVSDLGSASMVVDPAGPGEVLVSTLDGRLRSLDLATGRSEVVLDLRDQVGSGGERGLLGLALSPDGERLYLDFTNRDGDTEIRSLPVEDGRPVGGIEDSVLHLAVGQPYPNHNAGHLAFGPDGALWIGLGDGGSGGDPAGAAQDVDLLLGKMLRVVPDPAGGVRAPETNPDWDGRPEIWGIGLRNPWRYSFDRATNQLWVADVGQSDVEEVTVVDPAADRVNFGWDRVEGSRPFDGDAGPDLTDPVIEYGHDEGCSITGGHVYRGEAVPSLRGWYVFGDYCGGWVRAVPADEPVAAPVELVRGYGPVLSFAELEDGELLVLGQDGIHRVVQGEGDAP